jgi:hypothetical protein
VNHTNLINKNINKIEWKYFLNLASTEFPLRSNYEMTQILKLYNGANDIHSSSAIVRPVRYEFIYKSINETIPIITGHFKEPVPHKITISKGYAYGLFSRAFVAFTLSNQFALDFINWSKDTLIPDEM